MAELDITYKKIYDITKNSFQEDEKYYEEELKIRCDKNRQLLKKMKRHSSRIVRHVQEMYNLLIGSICANQSECSFVIKSEYSLSYIKLLKEYFPTTKIYVNVTETGDDIKFVFNKADILLNKDAIDKYKKMELD